jgi:hypothetical protein
LVEPVFDRHRGELVIGEAVVSPTFESGFEQPARKRVSGRPSSIQLGGHARAL